MEKINGNEQPTTPSKETNLDFESIQNGLNNDNAFSENGLENNRKMNKAMNQQKSE